MTVYNVLAAVVENVEAPTAAAAITIVENRLIELGWQVYPDAADAFEAEPGTEAGAPPDRERPWYEPRR